MRLRLLALFAALGAFSQIAQALLIREFLVLFHGNEISIGAFYGGWLFWIAVGGWSGARLERRYPMADPLYWVGIGTVLLPLLLGLEIAAARLLRLLLDQPAGQFIPLGHLLLTALVLTGPVGWLLGVLFPVACKGTGEERTTPVTSLYVSESLGALAGGALFTFVLIDHFGVWSILGVAALIPFVTLPGLQGKNRSRVGLAAAVIAVAATAVTLSTLGRHLEEGMERLRFRALHPQLTLVESLETRFGHVAVATLGEQTSVVVDGQIAASFPASRDLALESAFYYLQAGRPQRILLFGGALTGMPRELLRLPVRTLDVVVADRVAFAAIRPRLPEADRASLDDPRVRLHFEDGRALANRLAVTPDVPAYDLVLVRTADPASARHNRFFTGDFYRTLLRIMTPDGVLCTGVGAASNYLGRDVQSYSGSVFHTLGAVFADRVVAPGDRHLFCAAAKSGLLSADPGELERRYRAVSPAEEALPDGLFHTLLPPDRAAFVRERLAAEPGEENSDLKPVTFFLNMVLWGKFTASGMGAFLHLLQGMGVWPYLVPPGVFVTLFLFAAVTAGGEADRRRQRRTSALFALGVLGFVAMAAQLMTLFGYQARVGFIFSRIALLNGLFMSGLALGALLGRRLAVGPRPVTWLAWDLAAVALYGLLFPQLQAASSGLTGAGAEAVFLALSGLIGLLAGIGFPLTVELSHTPGASLAGTGGMAEAGDHLGGALGGFMTGGLLVPVLGIPGTGRLLAAAALLAVVPILAARLPVAAGGPWRRLATASFPFRRSVALAWFVVLSAPVLGWLAREAAPGARVTFDRMTLSGVSGSNGFTFREQPTPHYLGRDGEGPDGEGMEGENHTVSLASAPVTAGAAEIRGYAGPLNLLVAVDREGRVRGVTHVHSFETPAYIRGLPAWLESLKGASLMRQPLSLERIDALSGATITSRAALETINRAAAVGLRAGFGLDAAVATEGPAAPWTPQQAGILALMLLFVPVIRRNRSRERLLFMAASVLLVGFLANALLTEVDLANAALGRLPAWESYPVWWLVAGFAAVTTLLWGPVYCGAFCPFGALQELVSRLGARLGLGRRPAAAWETRGRFSKYLLLAAALALVGLSGDTHWLTYNPMQGFFGLNAGPWLTGVAALALLGALFFFRFWCRCWCPLGALLALGNRLVFFNRWLPVRRIGHCDLGVGHAWDVDCLRCNRCATGLTAAAHREQPSTRLFPILMILTALAITAHLYGGWRGEAERLGGWRRVDIEAVKSQIGSGRLSDREGAWYRRLEEP